MPHRLVPGPGPAPVPPGTGRYRRRIIIVFSLSTCVAISIWSLRKVGHTAPPPCPLADAPMPSGLQVILQKDLQRRKIRLASATALGSIKASSWPLREAAWREAAELAERARMETHAQLFGERLSESQLTLHSAQELLIRKGAHYAGDCPRYTGEYCPFDYWEPEFACECDERVPTGVVGDGPKWLCGVNLLKSPCTVLSIGSNFDDRFERYLHRSAGCRSLIVDPTLKPQWRRRKFAKSIAAYGSSLNSSVGVGAQRGAGQSAGIKSSFPLVTLRDIILDHYGAEPSTPLRLSVLKMDVEGHEYGALESVFELCAEGRISIDLLSVELHLHLPRKPTVGELYRLFDGALSCGLVLHHKERNAWGCKGVTCVEFSWVSLAHARRVHEAVSCRGTTTA